MRKKISELLVPAICLIPLLVGTAGYMAGGKTLSDALYAGIHLYSIGAASEACNGYVEFARWTAPIITATVILKILKSVWKNICQRMHLLGRKDSAAVYSDNKRKIEFDKDTSVIYPGDVFKEYAKSQILMFSSDKKNLEFYQEHKEALANKKVYIGLQNMELGCMKEMENVILFDVNSSIARMLWKKIKLWNEKKKNCNIVIYGTGALAQNVLTTGLQLNLYALDQKIEYHVISRDSAFRIKHDSMQLMNEDEIRYYDENDDKIWDVISDADIVIVTEDIPIEKLQMIAVKAEKARVYYYSPQAGEAEDYLAFESLMPFGRDKDVFTDGNIRRQELIRNAIRLNAEYAEKYQGEKDWNKLSGFLKASNISSADYGEIVSDYLRDLPEETLAALEHTRWCRFYFLNYWKYGIPENGKGKDTKLKIHKDLVLYDELDPQEREKDIATVRTWKRARPES